MDTCYSYKCIRNKQTRGTNSVKHIIKCCFDCVKIYINEMFAYES